MTLLDSEGRAESPISLSAVCLFGSDTSSWIGGGCVVPESTFAWPENYKWLKDKTRTQNVWIHRGIVTFRDYWFRNVLRLDMRFCFLKVYRSQLRKSRVNSWLNSKGNHDLFTFSKSMKSSSLGLEISSWIGVAWRGSWNQPVHLKIFKGLVQGWQKGK